MRIISEKQTELSEKVAQLTKDFKFNKSAMFAGLGLFGLDMLSICGGKPTDPLPQVTPTHLIVAGVGLVVAAGGYFANKSIGKELEQNKADLDEEKSGFHKNKLRSTNSL